MAHARVARAQPEPRPALPHEGWSVAVALAAATFYLALSGADVPTVRAWLMMSIMLIA
ncbi:MAG: ComEC/Rec2 family competence protein [Methyloceanibacter sp.]